MLRNTKPRYNDYERFRQESKETAERSDCIDERLQSLRLHKGRGEIVFSLIKSMCDMRIER